MQLLSWQKQRFRPNLPYVVFAAAQALSQRAILSRAWRLRSRQLYTGPELERFDRWRVRYIASAQTAWSVFNNLHLRVVAHQAQLW
jgi:hypothetical protein